MMNVVIIRYLLANEFEVLFFFPSFFLSFLFLFCLGMLKICPPPCMYQASPCKLWE